MTSAAPAGSGGRAPDGPRAAGGGDGGGAGGGGTSETRRAPEARAGGGGCGVGRSPESDNSDSSSGGRAGAAVPGSASAAEGGGGSCITSGTPESGTDLMSCHASPRRMPSVPMGCDLRSTGAPGLGTIGSRVSKSPGEATGWRELGGAELGGEGGGVPAAGTILIPLAPAAASRVATSSPLAPGCSARALINSNSCAGGGSGARAISPIPWKSRRCTSPVSVSPSHGTPFTSMRPPATRTVTEVSFNSDTSARNSAFCSSFAPGSRKRLTQRANRVARVSSVAIGPVNLGVGTPPPQREPALAPRLPHESGGPAG